MNKILILALSTLIVGTLMASNYMQQTAYEQWKSTHNKQYTAIEDQYRYGIYLQNLEIIKNHNADPTQTYEMGENQFMTLTNEEFVALYLIKNIEQPQPETTVEFEATDAGVELKGVDWRGITKVKAQGQCASGWAFAVTGSVEAFYYIRGGKQLIDVSEQQLVDCEIYSQGCNGGNTWYSFQYVAAYGIQPSTYYPYLGYQTVCSYTGGQYKINNNQKVTGVLNLQTALRNTPVSVGVDATNFQLYKSGIFSNCSQQYNHFALAVGYQDDGVWIVKNSWGLTWGEQGHIRLRAGETCGITLTAYQAL